jgi:16S rRNA G966 N2-methylase RsmD
MPTNYLFRIAHPDVQDFIIHHEGEDEKQFVLRQKEVLGLPAAQIAQQLVGRRKAKIKLPAWYQTKGIIYPPTLNLEQSSSQATALFKSKIVETMLDKKSVAVDLTGGLGVDSFYLSKNFNSFHYIEPDKELFEITLHNHEVLKAANIIHHNTDAEQFMDQTAIDFDLVFIDPSRRDSKSRKIIRLADCLPDVTQLQKTILNRTRFLLVKTSPLLDIQQGLRELDHVKKVYVVSVDNECKELLYLADKNYVGEVSIEAVDLFSDGQIRSTISFTLEAEKSSLVILGEPQDYLYEPNASILKAGAFKLIGEKYNLLKLGANTHLYTSDRLLENFPGRIFLIEVLNPEVKQLHELLPNGQVNIVTRNYPLKPEELKKKLKLHDGGDKYLIGFSSEKKKHLALCSRIINSK